MMHFYSDLSILKYWNKASSKDLINLHQNLRKFYRLDKKHISVKDIAYKILTQLKLKSLSSFILPMDVIPVHPTKYGYVFRIREVHANSKNEALSEVGHWVDSDFWNTPAKNVKHYGRLNNPKQSLLYLSFRYLVAMDETNVTPGDFFVCSQFKIMHTIKLVDMGFHEFKKSIINEFGIDSLKNEFSRALQILNIYENFFRKEFSQKVEFKWQYKVPIAIAHYIYNPRNFMDNNKYADGWLYPSVKIGRRSIFNDNVCIWPKSEHSVLRLDKAELVQQPYLGHNYEFYKEIR